MMLIDFVFRFISGVLGYEVLVTEDFFVEGLLDCLYYMRFEVLEGMEVLSVLLLGNYVEICCWCLKQLLGCIWFRRFEFLENLVLIEE